jgi:RNA-directed DNA polymerase
MDKEREKLRELTGSKRCFKKTRELIEEVNEHLAGWKNYYRIGYCRREFRQINYFVMTRLLRHLRRRSQRGYRQNRRQSGYDFVRTLGLKPL